MKKILLCCLLILILLTGCKKQAPSQKETAAKTEFSSGMWVSYTEINHMLESEKGLEEEFSDMLRNAQKLHIDRVYIHVRSHCDSIFKSDFFPLTETAKNADYDIFSYMIAQCHKKNIKVHAWINPYRVSATESEIDSLPSDSPAYRWHKDGKIENDKNVIVYNGIYLNPAEFEARQLVIDGVKEILEKYEVDGIHFDDYFYPTTDAEFDRESYKTYQKSAESPLSLADWRRANVDDLISSCKTAIELSGKQVVFSISPAASITKNYDALYADIAGWVEKGYLDEIIPQLYFGFRYKDESFCFNNLLETWKTLCRNNPNVKLTVGLAPYKIGTSTEADGTEWLDSGDVLLRQFRVCYNDPQIEGVVYFSYSGLFSEKQQNTTERRNLENFVASCFSAAETSNNETA